MENYKVADMSLAEHGQKKSDKAPPFILSLGTAPSFMRRDNWTVTERALSDCQNDIGMHGPFSSFKEMMADIDAEP